MTVTDEIKYGVRILPQIYSSLLFATTRTGECTLQVTDQDNIIDSADDTVRNLEPLGVLEIKELVIDLADHDTFNLLVVHIDDNVLDFADKHALIGVDLESEQIGNLIFHRYQRKYILKS